MIKVTEIRIKHHEFGIMDRQKVSLEFCNAFCMEAFRKQQLQYWQEVLEVKEPPIESYFDTLTIDLDNTNLTKKSL